MVICIDVIAFHFIIVLGLEIFFYNFILLHNIGQKHRQSVAQNLQNRYRHRFQKSGIGRALLLTQQWCKPSFK